MRITFDKGESGYSAVKGLADVREILLSNKKVRRRTKFKMTVKGAGGCIFFSGSPSLQR